MQGHLCVKPIGRTLIPKDFRAGVPLPRVPSLSRHFYARVACRRQFQIRVQAQQGGHVQQPPARPSKLQTGVKVVLGGLLSIFGFVGVIAFSQPSTPLLAEGTKTLAVASKFGAGFLNALKAFNLTQHQAWVLCAAIIATLCTALGPILTVGRRNVRIPSNASTNGAGPAATPSSKDPAAEERASNHKSAPSNLPKMAASVTAQTAKAKEGQRAAEEEMVRRAAERMAEKQEAEEAARQRAVAERQAKFEAAGLDTRQAARLRAKTEQHELEAWTSAMLKQAKVESKQAVAARAKRQAWLELKQARIEAERAWVEAAEARRVAEQQVKVKANELRARAAVEQQVHVLRARAAVKQQAETAKATEEQLAEELAARAAAEQQAEEAKAIEDQLADELAARAAAEQQAEEAKATEEQLAEELAARAAAEQQARIEAEELEAKEVAEREARVEAKQQDLAAKQAAGQEVRATVAQQELGFNAAAKHQGHVESKHAAETRVKRQAWMEVKQARMEVQKAWSEASEARSAKLASSRGRN